MIVVTIIAVLASVELCLHFFTGNKVIINAPTLVIIAFQVEIDTIRDEAVANDRLSIATSI